MGDAVLITAIRIPRGVAATYYFILMEDGTLHASMGERRSGLRGIASLEYFIKNPFRPTFLGEVHDAATIKLSEEEFSHLLDLADELYILRCAPYLFMFGDGVGFFEVFYNNEIYEMSFPMSRVTNPRPNISETQAQGVMSALIREIISLSPISVPDFE